MVRTASALDIGKQRQLVNQGVIGVLGDDVKSSDFELLAELAIVLDQGYERRILPMAGTGSVRAIEDLLLLRGVDIAIVQSDVLGFYEQADLYPDIGDKVAYLLKLYDREIHLVASTDIQSIEELEGKKVNFGPPSSGSYLTASLIFDALGIGVEPLDDDYEIAMNKLTQGEIVASVIVDAKPTRSLNDLPASAGLHLLAIPPAASAAPYTEAVLTAADYPGLVSDGAAVKTLAVPNVMAVYQWSKKHEKRAQLSSFFGELINGLTKLRQPPFHPKWREVDPAAEVQGWTRFE
jgi:TRAP-type uncharacterized transport system substrate-binding protein